MTITLDITGFYYAIEIESGGVKTVVDVLNRAKGVRAPNGGVLDYELDESNRFVGSISVKYDGASTPKTRQANSAFGPNRPVGTYSFSDDVFSPANRINNSGNIPGLLAWQYYVFDQNGLQQNSDRTITPVTEASASYELADGFRVVWRLIAIFGLNQFIDSARESLIADSKGAPLSLKSAGNKLSASNKLIGL